MPRLARYTPPRRRVLPLNTHPELLTVLTCLLTYTPQADASTSGATPSVNFFGAWVKLQGLKQLPKV